MLVNLLRWLAPLLVLPASYAVSRVRAYRRARYTVYFALLFGAFLLDLMGVSFRWDPLDAIVSLAVVFMIGEYFLNALRLRNRVLTAIILVAGAAAFFSTQFGWFTAGPAGSSHQWSPAVLATHVRSGILYSVKQREFTLRFPPQRQFELSREIRFSPFERLIRSYLLPDGYYQTEFGFTWTDRSNGVRLDLIDGNYVLWTLGEGL